MTEKQLEALKDLKGMSEEEIVKALQKMDTQASYVVENGDKIYYYDEDCDIDFSHVGIDKNEIDAWDNVKTYKCYRTNEEQQAQKRHNQLHMKIINRVRELNEGVIVADFERAGACDIWEVIYLVNAGGVMYDSYNTPSRTGNYRWSGLLVK